MDLTIRDIAQKANVSSTTVSRVLNRSKNVSEKTRKKVLAVIEEENYIPSATAISLSKRRSSIIGAVVPFLDNPFFGTMVRAFNERLKDSHFVMMCMSTEDTFKTDTLALESLRNYRVRGLIYTPAVDYSEKEEKKALKKQLKMMDCPIVLVDRAVSGLDLDGVYFKDDKAIFDATEALILAGHKKIALINGVKGRYLSRIRQSGYERALEEYGISLEKSYIKYGNYQFEDAYRKSVELLEMQDRPTAIITCNNTTSVAFINALHDKNLAYPKDIVFISLDNLSPLNITDPNFNYIERNSYDMGYKAIELLLDKIKGKGIQSTQEIFMNPRLFIKNI